jgi:hypothetical protein
MKSSILGCSVIESKMHGIRYFAFRGRVCTAHYIDESEESAEISKDLCTVVRNYLSYQNENGPACGAPNAFLLCSEIQAARTKIN